MKNMEYF